MRRALQILEWSVARVIILMSLLCLWTSRTRRLPSTTGTHVETLIVQSSPPESPVVSLRSSRNVCSCVRRRSVSVKTNSHRRHVNVTPIVPREALLSCLNRSHQLLPGSDAVHVYLTCLDRCHHAKWTQRTGPTLQEFPDSRTRVVGKIATTAKMMCLCVLMVGATSC